jgi:hypothetical protein
LTGVYPEEAQNTAFKRLEFPALPENPLIPPRTCIVPKEDWWSVAKKDDNITDDITFDDNKVIIKIVANNTKEAVYREIKNDSATIMK